MKPSKETYLEHSLKGSDEKVIWHHRNQEKVRRNIFASIERQTGKRPIGILRRLKQPIAVVLTSILLVGGSSILYLSEVENYGVIKDEGSGGKETTASKNQDNHKLSFYVDQQTNKRIQQMATSGIDLRLPQKLPVNNIELASVIKHKHGDRFNVFMTFMSNGKEVFTLSQESLNAGVIDHINQRITQIEDEADEKIHVEGATVYIKTDRKNKVFHWRKGHYGFTLASSQLSKEQLIQIAKSIDLAHLR